MVGKTYNIHLYKEIREAKSDLYNMVELERKRNRPYYVFNDFFNNEYPASINCKIFCLKERIVSDWEKYEEFNINRVYNNNNIINFPKKFEIFS
ncbi:MAG: hypothetical protein J5507_02905 [Clostridia bacterium]|nr:hypothetical protein [Clostridia bacterium]